MATHHNPDPDPTARKTISLRLPPQLLADIDQALTAAREKNAAGPVDRTDLIERALKAVLKFARENDGLLPLGYDLYPDAAAVTTLEQLAQATAQAREKTLERFAKNGPDPDLIFRTRAQPQSQRPRRA
jgi:hypothetical protein